jgi:hypothetical protein
VNATVILSALSLPLAQASSTGLIFEATQAQFPNAKSYEGRVALVRGVVQLCRGKPEIISNDVGQLRLPGLAASRSIDPP